MSALSAIKRIDARRALRGASVFVFTLLAVELMDELVYGAVEAAWPLVRSELGLTYAQVGLLLGLPGIIASLVEPVLGVLGDVWKRWVIIVLGGVAFATALFVAAGAGNFPLLMLGFAVMAPASGAFVSLSQASLMDVDPRRHEHLMARWTLAGSVGVVSGPFILGAAVLAGAGWRGLLAGLGAVMLALTLIVWRQRGRLHNGGREAEQAGVRQGLRAALGALRRWDVLRWLVLLEFSDFMLDVLLGFLALYFVDVVGVSPALAGLAVAVWSGVGLVGDALLIPLLERVRGLTYLRFSALVMLVLFPAFLLVPAYPAKLALLALMGLGNSGWYAILQGQLYSTMPGRSGTAMAANSAFGLVGGAIPALLGWVAQAAGLPVAMWLLLLGPVALLVGIPRLRAAGEHAPAP
jgi:FSR family fosmidomycin resistance protein-like MFS transporter